MYYLQPHVKFYRAWTDMPNILSDLFSVIAQADQLVTVNSNLMLAYIIVTKKLRNFNIYFK